MKRFMLTVVVVMATAMSAIALPKSIESAAAKKYVEKANEGLKGSRTRETDDAITYIRAAAKGITKSLKSGDADKIESAFLADREGNLLSIATKLADKNDMTSMKILAELAEGITSQTDAKSAVELLNIMDKSSDQSAKNYVQEVAKSAGEASPGTALSSVMQTTAQKHLDKVNKGKKDGEKMTFKQWLEEVIRNCKA
jgi:hypothetical protein